MIVDARSSRHSHELVGYIPAFCNASGGEFGMIAVYCDAPQLSRWQSPRCRDEGEPVAEPGQLTDLPSWSPSLRSQLPRPAGEGPHVRRGSMTHSLRFFDCVSITSWFELERSEDPARRVVGRFK